MTNKVYDVPAKYEYLCIKEGDGPTKIWGAYVTYYRWDWDTINSFLHRDKVVLFSGTLGKKLRYKFSDCPYRVNSYYRKYRQDGYIKIKDSDILNDYLIPSVHDGVSKLLMWDILRK